MLDKNQITKIATNLQTTEYNTAEEYCQHIFLSQFYQLPSSERVFFKGGTALRIVFASPRFSEDLDFSSDLMIKDLQPLFQKTLKAMETYAIQTEALEAKATSGGFLAIFVCKLLDFSVQLQVEVSKRNKKDLEGEIFSINSDFIQPYTLYNLKTEMLVSEKIQATLTRKKPRDFFDIYFLLRSRLIIPSQKKDLLKIKTLIEKSEINFSRELKQFLPISFHNIIKDFKKTLVNEINRNVA
ncbi:hypothetical protein A2331_07140 [Candidatus Falkowbacteria bacterium RIFOXYB2_FULL_34_18]|uniref:Nucleotidyl transferase AbiEii/AbiGii toxin family protein n=1 Tax=Candidatus Falkowbacteria bacterium RIFOXYD2_FULL_34_120 TaxID=1798007 RepID=A0A1F5TRK8_9BACT|nr:MAG: hypothetical protein A2331_07140 [Candidatus Falkowbacteria bacterium RIFOXYB2_FULL_34_18]OGF29908.1 MAG: hypothetical protein A2500_03535 [Candidatus Falkowbacteria bacterium RIFOXYC12_FULL_34_55]OGF37234.1 MAG: hypothetical protein A2466_02980 [Candidatus Falkowbacteria bacterium RIFOXYC2_FULL_34_220]OGF39446.1 MAG: hypothetical protein A2515_03910 [Candidatus Falkowbacteria bacterium RIFOXYD12_FULL_34_57]OGF41572.1 MAG: hypothetical protein A2531_02695 [Candidatus Falkowbacteria bact